MECVDKALASNGISHDAADEVRSAVQSWVERANVDLHCSAKIQLPFDDPRAAELIRHVTDANVAALRKQVQALIGAWLVDVIWLEVEKAILKKRLRGSP